MSHDAVTSSWAKKLQLFSQADNQRAWFELALTGVLFTFLWFVAFKAAQINFLLAIPAILLCGGFLVRLFVIQHDCGHKSYFTTLKLNNFVGRALGVVTFTPFAYWSRMHAGHHAGSGCLEKRGVGDIDTLTVEEYQNLSKWKRFGYRAYRNPIIMFVIGPAYIFILRHRYPAGMNKMNSGLVKSVLYTNLFILIQVALIAWLAGPAALFTIHLPIVMVAGSIGIWLFYVQHQFDDTTWDEKENWEHAHAALHGSSFYDLPPFLMWLTGNIGVHHVHHLSTRIPFYKLPAVLKKYPELKSHGRLTLWESFKCVNLALWDTGNRKLVSFREISKSKAAEA